MAILEIEVDETAHAMWELMKMGGANPQIANTITYRAKATDTENYSGAFGDNMSDAIRNAFKNWNEGWNRG